MAAVAAKAYGRIVVAWKLNNHAAAALVAVSPRTWSRMKQGAGTKQGAGVKGKAWSGRLSRDQLLRISALTGLYKALHLYFNDSLADRWVMLPNQGPLFGGRTPLAVMIEGGLPAILDIRTYVDALRGGV